jgi:cbb3-type cytochrome oxidase maturation protein
MTIIILLIAISLSIAILFLVIFYWNMRSGQYDDTYTPSVRMLFDNKPVTGTALKKDSVPQGNTQNKEAKGRTNGVPDNAHGIG